MLDAIFEFFVNCYGFFISLIDKIFLMPIYSTVNKFFPVFTGVSDYLNAFLNNYFYKGISFAREVFLNITGVPRSFFLALLITLMARFTAMIAFYTVKAVINAWALFRTGKSAISAGTDIQSHYN